MLGKEDNAKMLLTLDKVRQNLRNTNTRYKFPRLHNTYYAAPRIRQTGPP